MSNFLKKADDLLKRLAKLHIQFNEQEFSEYCHKIQPGYASYVPTFKVHWDNFVVAYRVYNSEIKTRFDRVVSFFPWTSKYRIKCEFMRRIQKMDECINSFDIIQQDVIAYKNQKMNKMNVLFELKETSAARGVKRQKTEAKQRNALKRANDFKDVADMRAEHRLGEAYTNNFAQIYTRLYEAADAIKAQGKMLKQYGNRDTIKSNLKALKF
jgi:DNA-binding helix-hairpin-helix protein with protein kinase domain